jgi:CYTH domain-containing protein
MAVEIERRFLVESLPALDPGAGREITQGYLRADERASVRVRLADDEAWLTVKGALQGLSRSEFEYPVPAEDAREMLELAVGHTIRKRRFTLHEHGRLWELDVFDAPNDGLVIAEVELPSEEAELVLPSWVGREISGERRYLNANLSSRPYEHWTEAERQG